MDLYLTNKLALTIGSTKGIGEAITTEMAHERADVIINGRNEAEVTKTVKEIQTTFPDTRPQVGTTDISIENQRVTLLEKFPKVDILVSNMGIFEPMEYWDIDDVTWGEFFITDVLSDSASTKAYLSKALAQDSGCTIFIVSEEVVMPSGKMPQYSMTKTMDLSLAKSLSNLTVGTHVTANTVMPGSTLTEGMEKVLEDMHVGSDAPKEGWERDFMEDHRSRLQIQRLIRPEEIGRFATFIISPGSSSLSGEALRVDGGLVPTIF